MTDEPTRPIVLCVRHPDFSNEYTVEGGDVRIIDIDLGRSFDGRPDDLDQWEDWSSSILLDVEDLPADSVVRKQVETLVADLRPE